MRKLGKAFTSLFLPLALTGALIQSAEAGEKRSGSLPAFQGQAGIFKLEGFFIEPEVEGTVWIEFEAGDLSRPIHMGTCWNDEDVAFSFTKSKDKASKDLQQAHKKGKIFGEVIVMPYEVKGGIVMINVRVAEFEQNDGDDTEAITMCAETVQ